MRTVKQLRHESMHGYKCFVLDLLHLLSRMIIFIISYFNLMPVLFHHFQKSCLNYRILGLVEDFRKSLEVIAPVKGVYAHDEKWHDGNGFSHIRSSLIGTSKTIPVVSKSLMTGTWQQIILVDFDNRPRSRKVFVQVFGE